MNLLCCKNCDLYLPFTAWSTPAGAFDGRNIHTELLLRDLSRIASSSIINIDGCLHMISDAVHIERLVTVCSSFYRAILLIVRHTKANTGLNL